MVLNFVHLINRGIARPAFGVSYESFMQRARQAAMKNRGQGLRLEMINSEIALSDLSFPLTQSPMFVPLLISSARGRLAIAASGGQIDGRNWKPRLVCAKQLHCSTALAIQSSNRGHLCRQDSGHLLNTSPKDFFSIFCLSAKTTIASHQYLRLSKSKVSISHE